jgi:hypothetical protein
MLDYHSVPMLAYCLTGNFLLLRLYYYCMTNQRGILFGCLLRPLVQGYQCPFLCFLEYLCFLPWMLRCQDTLGKEFLLLAAPCSLILGSLEVI